MMRLKQWPGCRQAYRKNGGERYVDLYALWDILSGGFSGEVNDVNILSVFYQIYGNFKLYWGFFLIYILQ